jgi:hypothetical protein
MSIKASRADIISDNLREGLEALPTGRGHEGDFAALVLGFFADHDFVYELHEEKTECLIHGKDGLEACSAKKANMEGHPVYVGFILEANAHGGLDDWLHPLLKAEPGTARSQTVDLILPRDMQGVLIVENRGKYPVLSESDPKALQTMIASWVQVYVPPSISAHRLLELFRDLGSFLSELLYMRCEPHLLGTAISPAGQIALNNIEVYI